MWTLSYKHPKLGTKRQWLTSLPGHITFDTHWLGGCMCPRGTVWPRLGGEKQCSASNRNPITQWPRPTHYTNRDISVLSVYCSVHECTSTLVGHILFCNTNILTAIPRLRWWSVISLSTLATSGKWQWIDIQRKPPRRLNYNKNPSGNTCHRRRQKQRTRTHRIGLEMAPSAGSEKETPIRVLAGKYIRKWIRLLDRDERKISLSRYCYHPAGPSG